MAEIIDQIVKISIQDAISSVETVDVNTVAIVGKVGATTTTPTAFTPSTEPMKALTAKAVAEAYGADSEIYAMASAFFAQDSQPSELICIPLANDGAFSTAIGKAKTAAESFAFYHVIAATDDAAVTATEINGTNKWQEWLAEAHKVLHLQVYNGGSQAAAITAANTFADALDSASANRCALYLHKENGTGGSREFLPVGIVAGRCASDSARGTFAHKKCRGVTFDSYSATDYAALQAKGVNVYTKVAGEARLFMGTTQNKETFIDNIVKDDWIRFNVQSRIYQLLGEANNGNGVTYDDAGIAAVAAAVLNVLTVAQDTDHQYVMVDSATVDYKPYSYLAKNYAEDVRKRNLPLISGRYARMNSIHTVVQVQLLVTI